MSWRRTAAVGVIANSLIISSDGPSRMVRRPTGSDGEPSSPNRGASAGVEARQIIHLSASRISHVAAASTRSLPGFFYRRRRLQRMIGNLRGHQSQRRQRIRAADDTVVSHLGSHRVTAQTFGGGDDAFFNTAQARVAVKRFAFVADAVFVL